MWAVSLDLNSNTSLHIWHGNDPGTEFSGGSSDTIEWIFSKCFRKYCFVENLKRKIMCD